MAMHQLRIRKSLQRRLKVAAVAEGSASRDYLGAVVSQIARMQPSVEDVSRARMQLQVPDEDWKQAERVADSLGYATLADLVNERLAATLPELDGYR